MSFKDHAIARKWQILLGQITTLAYLLGLEKEETVACMWLMEKRLLGKVIKERP